MEDGVAFTSIQNVLGELPNRPVASSRDRGWSDVTVDLHDPSDYIAELPGRDHHVVIYNRSGVGKKFQKRGGVEHLAIHRPGDFIIMPAGTPSFWEGAATSTGRLRIPVSLFESVAAEATARDPNRIGLRNVFQIRDPILEKLCALIIDQVSAPRHPAQSIFVTSLSTAIVAHLVTQIAGVAVQSPTTAGLPPRVLARVIEYIETTTDQTTNLDALAQIAGCGRFHFCRLFRASTGVTPMRFVEQARLRRAADLIRAGGLPLNQIALIVGFADQSHFTRRFRRQNGVTPAVFARDQRSQTTCRPPIMSKAFNLPKVKR